MRVFRETPRAVLLTSEEINGELIYYFRVTLSYWAEYVNYQCDITGRSQQAQMM